MQRSSSAQEAFERARGCKPVLAGDSKRMARTNSIETIQKTLDLAGQELRILHQISQSISATLDLDQVLRQIIDLVIDVTRGDSCLLYLLDETGDNLVLHASKNPHPRLISKIAKMMQARVCSIMLVDFPKNELVLKAAKCSSEEYWQKPNLKIGNSLISRVVKEKAPLMVRDVTKEESYRYPELATKEGVRSLLSVPMILKDHVIGVINVYSADERVFSNEDLRVLSTVADQAALAFENTKLTVAIQESQEALQTRKLVERAKSILQRQANLNEEEAYKRLQQQSMRTRRSMREIAEAVILSSELS